MTQHSTFNIQHPTSSDEFLVRSRHLVLPDETVDGYVQVGGGKISAIYRSGDRVPDLPLNDIGECWLLPGLVDTHVHINEPGRTEWEGFATATAAAAAGGITTLVDMPLNSDPVTTTADAFRKKMAAAEGKLAVDCGFHAGLIPGNTADLPELIEMGVLGVKAFMVYSGIPEFPAATQKEFAEAMPLLAQHRIPLLAHAELDSAVMLPPGDGKSYRRYLASRPSSWEVDAIGLLIACCRETGCPVHIVHLATADALPLLMEAKAEGLPVTVETCPHYLHFCAENIPDEDTRFKCAPPVREQSHREALWNELSRGLIDMVVSDHSPCPPYMKQMESGDFMKAWGGISSLQLGVSIMCTELLERKIPLHYLAAWMSAAPAQLAGLYPRKGVIAIGSDADLTVLNPAKSFVVKADKLRHRHKITPYENEKLYGVVERTYLRGHVVYDVQQECCDYHGRVLLRR